MKTFSPLGKLLLPLLAALSCVSGQVKPTYFEVGGNLQLRPSTTETITNIVWKHNGNLLAEWVKDAVPLTYYGQFRNRTTLEINTGVLKIQKMTAEDVGSYTVEINSKVQAQSYEGKVIQKVGKPSVLVQPLVCSPASESCTLTCTGATPEAEPVEYSWKKGDEKMDATTKVVPINHEMDGVKTFSCSMKNPVSEAESDPEKNPYYKEVTAESGIGVGAIAAIIIFVVILPAAAVITGVLWKFKLACFSSRGSHTVTDSSPHGLENGRQSPPAGPANELTAVTPEGNEMVEKKSEENPLLQSPPGADADPPAAPAL